MAISIDLSKYQDRKSKGLQSIRKVGSAFVFEQRQFSAETGEETLPITQAFSREDMEKLRAQVAAQLGEIDSILAELDLLSPPKEGAGELNSLPA